MALAPEDIQNKTFPAVVRGYERSAVDAFLREVADEVRRLQALASQPAGDRQRPSRSRYNGAYGCSTDCP